MYAKRAVLLVAATLVASCNKDALQIESTSASLTINQNTEALAEGLALAAGFLGQTESVRWMNETCVDSCSTDQPPVCTTSCTRAPVDTEGPSREAARWLKDYLFNDAHVNAGLTTSTEVVYCLKASEVCDTDAQCLQALTAVPVCVKAQSFAAGEFDLALLIGAQQQHNPLNFHLVQDSVKIEARLADVKASYQALLTATSEPLPEGFPSKMQGRASWTVTKVAPRVVSSRIDVDEAILIGLNPEADEHYVEFAIAQAAGLVEVTLDGDAKTVTTHLGLKAIDLLISAQTLFGDEGTPACLDCVPPTPPTPPRKVLGQLLAHLDGASFDATFVAAAAETLIVTNVSLGTGTSKVQFKHLNSVTDILKFDLNAALNRRFDLTVTRRADGAALAVTPGFDAVLDLDFNAVAPQNPELKGAGLKGLTEVKLTPGGATLFFPDWIDEVKVESGTLLLIASGSPGQADVNLTVNQGMCVGEKASTTPPDDGAHPFAGLMVGSCTPQPLAP